MLSHMMILLLLQLNTTKSVPDMTGVDLGILGEYHAELDSFVIPESWNWRCSLFNRVGWYSASRRH